MEIEGKPDSQLGSEKQKNDDAEQGESLPPLPELQVKKKQESWKLGLLVKKDTTSANLIALPLIYFVATCAGAYYNTAQLSLLTQPGYFDIPAENIGVVQSNILFYSMLVTVFISLGVGYCFDLFGRRLVILISFLAVLGSTISLPWMKTIGLMVINRIAMQLSLQFLHSHPLVIDYVKSDSRGKATALQILGNGTGECFAMVVLVGIQIKYEPEKACWIVGAIIAAVSIITWAIVREPKVKKAPKEQSNVPEQEPLLNSQMEASTKEQTGIQEVFGENDGLSHPSVNQTTPPSKCENLKILTKRLWAVTCSKPKYIFCFIASMCTRLITVLFSVYLLMWLQSFATDGTITGDKQALNIYRKMTIATVVCTLLVLPLVGWGADKAPSSIVIPLAFLFRGLSACCFQFVQDPRHPFAFFTILALVITTLAQNLAVYALFSRNMAGDVRGAMNGLFHFFGLVGLCIFTGVAGYLFDHINPSAPFSFVGYWDGLILFISLPLACCGWLNEK